MMHHAIAALSAEGGRFLVHMREGSTSKSNRDAQHAYNALSSCRNALLLTLTTLALESHARKSRSMWRFSCNVLYVLTVNLRFVETKYKLEIGAAQTTQLSKAIINGAEKGVFVLPKG